MRIFWRRPSRASVAADTVPKPGGRGGKELERGEIYSRKKAATIETMMMMTRIMAQQQTRPQQRPLPPLVKAPLCSSDLHILKPSFLGICPSAAICHQSEKRGSGYSERRMEGLRARASKAKD